MARTKAETQHRGQKKCGEKLPDQDVQPAATSALSAASLETAAVSYTACWEFDYISPVKVQAYTFFSAHHPDPHCRSESPVSPLLCHPYAITSGFTTKTLERSQRKPRFLFLKTFDNRGEVY